MSLFRKHSFLKIGIGIISNHWLDILPMSDKKIVKPKAVKAQANPTFIDSLVALKSRIDRMKPTKKSNVYNNESDSGSTIQSKQVDGTNRQTVAKFPLHKTVETGS